MYSLKFREFLWIRCSMRSVVNYFGIFCVNIHKGTDVKCNIVYGFWGFMHNRVTLLWWRKGESSIHVYVDRDFWGMSQGFEKKSFFLFHIISRGYWNTLFLWIHFRKKCGLVRFCSQCLIRNERIAAVLTPRDFYLYSSKKKMELTSIMLSSTHSKWAQRNVRHIFCVNVEKFVWVKSKSNIGYIFEEISDL